MATPEQITAWACARHFHQSLTLPAADGSPARVTYGTTSNIGDAAAPAVLFCGPLGISRLALYLFDHVAVQAGVRLVYIDRPGFGGSTRLPVDQRIAFHLQSVEAVLARLGIEHVALMGYSAGTIYLHNIWEQLPHLLHPERPLATVFAPWVHPTYSKSKLLGLAESLPQSWIASFNTLNRIVAPTVGFSAGMLEGVTALFRSTSAVSEAKCREAYGMSSAAFSRLEKTLVRHIGAEDKSSVGDDMLLCLRKPQLSWGTCDDVPAFVRKMSSYHADRIANDASAPSTDKRLVLRAVFAQEDIMIGKGGQTYYEQCWSDAAAARGIAFESVTVPASNHDNVALPPQGQLAKELHFVKARMQG